MFDALSGSFPQGVERLKCIPFVTAGVSLYCSFTAASLEALARVTLDEMRYLGRPAGIAVTNDGALLVSDDDNGAIYRVSYRAAEGDLKHSHAARD